MDGLQVPNRSVRCEDELWNASGEKARTEPRPVWRSRAAIIRAFLAYYAASPAHMDTLLRDLGDIEDIHVMFGRNGNE